VRGEQQSIVVIPLKLAFATELAPEIDQLMTARMQGASANSLMPRPQIGVATTLPPTTGKGSLGRASFNSAASGGMGGSSGFGGMSGMGGMGGMGGMS